MAGLLVLRVLQPTSSHRQYYLSTAWLVFWFLGFWGFYNLHQVTDNITWSTAWLVFGLLGFWEFYNLHQVTDNITWSTAAWLVFGFLGFWWFYRLHQVTDNITWHCMVGFWVFRVLRVLQPTSSHRQYYLSTAWLVLGFLGFWGFYNLHQVTDNITWALHGWFLGFWGFDGFIDYIKSQTILLRALHGWFLGFWGFEGFMDYIKSQTILLEHCIAGFWVFGVLRVLQPTSSHRQYYLSTAWLVFGFLGFWGFYNLHQVTDNITWALHGWFLGF